MKVLKRIRIRDVIFLPGVDISKESVTQSMIINGFVQELPEDKLELLFDTSSEECTIEISEIPIYDPNKPSGNRNR